MNILGLDLGTNQIKSVEIRREKEAKPFLVNYALMPAPQFSFLSENKDDFSKYAKELREFLEAIELSATGVVASLPEDKAFSQVIYLPQMPEKDLKNAISYEAEQHLPLPLEEATFSWQVIGNSTNAEGQPQLDILLVAAPKGLVQRYVDLVEAVGLSVVALESESSALARLVNVNTAQSMTTLVVNFGSATTSLVIASQGSARFTRSVSTGGWALTKSLSQGLGFEVPQAEEYKRIYGLEEEQLEGRVAEILKPVFNVIVEEIRRAISFYDNQKPGDEIKRVVLCGGSARLPGVLTSVASQLSLETELLDPWEGLEVPSRFPASELEELGQALAVASGLALRNP